jgi:hypothetical protein
MDAGVEPAWVRNEATNGRDARLQGLGLLRAADKDYLRHLEANSLGKSS